MAPATSGSGGGGDDRILSYHDEVLRRSDLAILRGPNFINDRIISFFFTHLSLSLPPSTLLIPPSLSYLVPRVSDPGILSPLDLPSKTLILFPVNDNPDPGLPEGGAHWSLLVYDRPSNSFVHHDSLGGLNGRCARSLFSAVRGLVGGEGGEAGFVEGRTPQQGNGYDCGLFVMAVARAVCEWRERGGEGAWFEEVEAEAGVERVERLRGEVLELIEGLMERT